MSGTRGACAQCRSAKAKCEYGVGSSSCMRCNRRQIICSGSSPGSNYQFRDENEVAQRNSRRARRESKGAIVLAAPLAYRDLLLDPPDSSEEEEEDSELQQQFPWLNAKGLATVSEPLRRDLDTRAIDRFFIDWTLYPYKHRAPGYFSELPGLYHSAPEGCVLTHAVRAIAFADMKNSRSNDPSFYVKARRNYGAALARMRELAQDEQKTSDDCVLAGLLLIDNFELMYLARAEPLGLHDAAVRHVLRLRGDGQLHSRASYHLWDLAHRRMQYRQMLTRQDPEPAEVEFMSRLNAKVPDVHLSLDVLHMNILVAAARHLMETPASEAASIAGRAAHLAGSMQSLLDSIASWTSNIDDYWKPKQVSARQLFGPNEVADGRFPSPPFLGDSVLEYQDFWFAAVNNFHASSQIILRESLIELVEFDARNPRRRSLAADEEDLIRAQKAAIADLSAKIVQSMPMLLGFSEEPESREPFALHQGRMVARNCLRFPSLVIQQAQYVPLEHKDIAEKVMDWIHVVHGLS